MDWLSYLLACLLACSYTAHPKVADIADALCCCLRSTHIFPQVTSASR